MDPQDYSILTQLARSACSRGFLISPYKGGDRASLLNGPRLHNLAITRDTQTSMPLSWNEIRDRALAFSNEWGEASSEAAESQTFWNEFFHIFGITLRRVAAFENAVTKLDGRTGNIDLLWKGTLLVEHKSRGKSLDHARDQALNYFAGLEEHELPRYVLVSDFARLRLYDLDEGGHHEFGIQDLHKNIQHFAFIAGYQTHKLKEQDPVNIKAAELMGKLHDQLRDIGYTGHALEVYLVRLLFCLFAEDTGIFQRQQFQDCIENRTAEDGADLGAILGTLFVILNTPADQRLSNQDEVLNAFPYINGKLFEEHLLPAAFDRAMRKSLLHCCELDWSRISPAIFGSLFQSIMDKDARRNLGAHYTSEKNILKLINPLFMDDLRAEFEKVKKSKNKLFEFHKTFRSLKFLDPACGCGNFLVIAYRELRLLELEILRTSTGTKTFDIHTLIAFDVDQFYGIEIEEFPAQIAQVAMWLVDHQMNVLVSEEFGMYFVRIPLTTSANIVHGNALRMDWREVVAPPEQLSYIMGNPPFVGKSFQSPQQKQDMKYIYGDSKYGAGLDYVTAWYKKTLDYIQDNSAIQCAFVSANSITQGEQVYMLWPGLLKDGIYINFAHRTFKWTNEAKGKAAVHCVIIGFGLVAAKKKRLFVYEDIEGEPSEIGAFSINPYLIDAGNIIISAIRTPLCNCPEMIYGSKPVDGGNLLLNGNEKRELILAEPKAKKWIRPFLNSEEFLHNKPRYCLWLVDCPPSELKSMPLVLKRVAAVKLQRESSAKLATRKQADTPTLFGEMRSCKHQYLLVPAVSSERRVYIPVGYLKPKTISSNANFQIPNASLYDFGVITSLMHMAWMRTVCGRLKSDYRYSASIGYNNFPWPENPTEKQTAAIKTKAQAVLDARAQFPDDTLADLYDPLTMPPALKKAHQALDKAVDRAYRKNPFNTEADRVAFLFDLYQQYTAPLLPREKKRRRRS